ncbi:hypothetical protein HAX54_051349 [Datura stramonium]|uniref:Uncharacterized protein n=1 Tax=Datura stramonium TaxID=4076 RepID=A0ABS8SXJ0_DATST|nr:hypothetical protein [Datura stramonium]
MTQKHPKFHWSNPNVAENPQRLFNQKQQVQGPPDFLNQNKGQQNFQQYQQKPQINQKSNIEELLNKRPKATDDLIHKHIRAIDEKVESHHSAIKNLEIQEDLDDPYVGTQENSQNVK